MFTNNGTELYIGLSYKAHLSLSPELQWNSCKIISLTVSIFCICVLSKLQLILICISIHNIALNAKIEYLNFILLHINLFSVRNVHN